MAGTLTHYKIGLELLDYLPKDVDKDIFLTAVQGHDLLMFIKLKDYFKFKKIRKNIRILQNTKCNELINEFILNIRKSNDSLLKSFLYGYLTHHITDGVIHPFIIYNSGYYDGSNETKKYLGHHELLESIIDVNLVNFKDYPRIKYDKNKINELSNKVNDIFYKIYGINVGKYLVINMLQVYPFIKIYRQDKFGLKRQFYLLFSKLTNNKYEFLSYHYPKKYNIFDCNKKITWYNPVTGKKNKDSFMDLIELSKEKSIDAINLIEKMLIDNTSTNIDLDYSSTTGLKNYTLKDIKYYSDIFSNL